MRTFAYAFTLTLFIAPHLPAQGKLSRIRNKVNPPPPPKKEEKKEDREETPRSRRKTAAPAPHAPLLPTTKLNQVRQRVNPAPTHHNHAHDHRSKRHYHRPSHRRFPRYCDYTVGLGGYVEQSTIIYVDDPAPIVVEPQPKTGVIVPQPEPLPLNEAPPTMHVEPIVTDLREYLPQYPYQGPFEGYVVERGDPLPIEDFGSFGRLGGRFSVENGDDFDGLNRTNVHLLLQTAYGLGLQTRIDFLNEDLGHGYSDSLTLSTTEILLFILTSESLQSFIGLGFRVLDDRYGTDLGYNFTWGVDFFPVKPFVVSFVLDTGDVGDADVFHVRTTFGVLYRRFELFAGYDYRTIGGVKIQGPLAGLRLWF